MPKIQLLGRVLPPAMIVNLHRLPTVSWKGPVDISITVRVENSNVVIDCELDKWDKDEHMMPVYMRALDTARVAVDLCSFQSGLGMSVVLESLVDVDGTKSLLMAQHPSLSAFSGSVQNAAPPQTPAENNYDKVFRCVAVDVPSFRALHDLIEAITQTHVAPVACGRAMEGIRHVIAPGLERKKGWTKMNDALRMERSYLDLILDTSTGPRHADPAHVTGDVCKEITERSWVVMNRFFEYLKRGSQPLPVSELSYSRKLVTARIGRAAYRGGA
jgi:hypothetical protein